MRRQLLNALSVRRTSASAFSQALVFAGGVCSPRSSHRLPDSVDLLPRDFTHLFLDPRHSERRRLNAHAGADAWRHKRPRRGNGLHPGVDPRLHAVDVV